VGYQVYEQITNWLGLLVYVSFQTFDSAKPRKISMFFFGKRLVA